MLSPRTAIALTVALAMVSSGVVVAVLATAGQNPQKPQTWTLSGAGFAGGSFENVTLVNNSLQLAPRLPPSTRTMVLDIGPPGSADGAGVYLPFVLHDSDGSYKMWYTGNSGNHGSILLAESMDGLHWTKVGVVMDLSNGAQSPFVMKIGSTYHMWFTLVTWCCSVIGYQDEIYHTTSTDGVHWSTPGFAVGVGAAGSWDADTVSEPWIVQDASGLYRMFYGGWNDNAQVQIGEATSTDLANWTPYSGNPVVRWGAAGDWDSAALAMPSVMRDGSAWTLYYGGRTSTSKGAIGRAFSSDGYNWTKDSANPVIGPEASPAWDDISVGSPDLFLSPTGLVLYFNGVNATGSRIGVLTFTGSSGRTQVLASGPAGSPDADAIFSASVLHDSDGTYKMYYTGLANSWYTTMLATSTDGVTFTKQGAVLPTNTSNAVPFVMKVASTYHMWYEIVGACGPWGWCDEIYTAISSDGVTWTPQGLALGLGATGAWDEASVSDAHVVYAGNGTSFLYYTGTAVNHDAEIGVAMSTDLVHWTRYAHNPIVPFGAPGAWDNAHAASPSVSNGLTGSTWTLYYYGFANGSTASIGRATSVDGLNWTKDSANPVITPEPGPAWDDTSVAFPDFSVDSSGMRLYFRGSNATTSSIGMYSFSALPVMYLGQYQSVIFNSGQSSTTWLSLSGVTTTPTDTSIGLFIRVGRSATPDATWTAWTPAGDLSSLPRTRYAQVSVVFTSFLWDATPTASSVTLTYMPGSGGL